MTLLNELQIGDCFRFEVARTSVWIVVDKYDTFVEVASDSGAFCVNSLTCSVLKISETEFSKGEIDCI